MKNYFFSLTFNFRIFFDFLSRIWRQQIKRTIRDKVWIKELLDHLQNTNFHNVLGIHLDIRSLWIWVQESNLHQFTKFFVNLELIFQKFHHFRNVKITFLKDICRELHWKTEIFLPWPLSVNFWVSEHGSRLKNWQFHFLLKFI